LTRAEKIKADPVSSINEGIPMADIRRKLANQLAQTIETLGGDTDADTVLDSFAEPPDPEMGDIAFPVFPLARVFRKAPPKIAAELAEALRDTVGGWDEVAEIRNDGPYLNFKLDTESRARRVVSAALKEGYGASDIGAGKTIGIDYSSPNIAKPFGIGHLRSTSIGNALRNIFERQGYDVVGVNHLGDWGTQFGKLMAAFERWGDEGALEEDPIDHLYELYVHFHKEAEDNEELLEEGRAWFRRLEQGDEDAHNYWERFRALSLVEFQKIYERLGVSFDHYWGEAFYNDMLEDLVEDIESKGIAEESEGALVVDVGDDMPPCLIKKQDGATLYATRDLAAARYRYEQLGFDQFLYVVGAEQTVHFRQVFTVLERMGYDWAKDCHHIAFGRIHGISTRKGTLVFLEDILERGRQRVAEILADKDFSEEEREEIVEQVTVGAILFYDLSRNRIKNYDFDWDLMLRGLGPDERGQTGPYLQYTHTRLLSLAETYRDTFGVIPTADALDASKLAGGAEEPVIREIERYPEVIEQAAEHYEPALVSRYALDLAEAFNSYYSGGNKVVSDDKDLSTARILLCEAVRQTLADALTTLGVPLPKRM
jgi:arginyl-tRNA synthetase